MSIGVSDLERRALRNAYRQCLDIDIAPNDLFRNRRDKSLFLIGYPGEKDDYGINCKALRYCLKEQQAYPGLICLVVLSRCKGVSAIAADEEVIVVDLDDVWEVLKDKPSAPGKNGHGRYWWLNPRMIGYRSPGPVR